MWRTLVKIPVAGAQSILRSNSSVDGAGLPAHGRLITACYRDHVDSEINDNIVPVNGFAEIFAQYLCDFQGAGQFDPNLLSWPIRALRMLVGVILCCESSRSGACHPRFACCPSIARTGLATRSCPCSAGPAGAWCSIVDADVTEANEGAVHLYARLVLQRKTRIRRVRVEERSG